MHVKISQPLTVIVWVVLAYSICITTSVAQQLEKPQPFDSSTVPKTLMDSVEPWIHSEDFEEFLNRLTLSEEMETVAKKQYEQYKQRGNILKQDAGAEMWKAGLLEIIETHGNLLERYDIEYAQEICRKVSKCEKRMLQKLMLHRDEFLEELHTQLNVDEDSWTNAKMWIRRQPFVHIMERSSWRDLTTFPDLIEQYEEMIRNDKDFLKLLKPSSEIEKEVVDTVQTLLRGWALQTDAYVDTYIIQGVRWRWIKRLTSLSPNHDAWLIALRKNCEIKRRRYNICSTTSEAIASVIEPIVSTWAAERWRRTIEIIIFPESCPQNSFELQYISLVENGILTGEDEEAIEQLALPLLQKLSRLRRSLRKAAWWYNDHLALKRKGYVVPSFPITLKDVDEKYLETVNAMLDILHDHLSLEDSLALSSDVIESRIRSTGVDRPFPNARYGFLSTLGSEDNQKK